MPSTNCAATVPPVKMAVVLRALRKVGSANAWAS
jgi:hypothetical protein